MRARRANLGGFSKKNSRNNKKKQQESSHQGNALKVLTVFSRLWCTVGFWKKVVVVDFFMKRFFWLDFFFDFLNWFSLIFCWFSKLIFSNLVFKNGLCSVLVERWENQFKWSKKRSTKFEKINLENQQKIKENQLQQLFLKTNSTP